MLLLDKIIIVFLMYVYRQRFITSFVRGIRGTIQIGTCNQWVKSPPRIEGRFRVIRGSSVGRWTRGYLGALASPNLREVSQTLDFSSDSGYPRVTMSLSIRHQRFVAALLAEPTHNQTRAYESVFSARGATATSGASELMAMPEIRAAVDAGLAARLKRLELTADDVLRDIALGVASDGGELADHVLDSCRYCHGHMHRYQSTPAEYERNLADYLAADAARKGGPRDPMGLEFDIRGGVGYDPRKPPVDDCPECFGRGVARIIGKDTRYLSEAGRRMYSGVKMTKHGPELQVRSRDKALEIAAKHTGVAKETHIVKTIRDLTEEELDAKTKALEEKLKAGAKP